MNNTRTGLKILHKVGKSWVAIAAVGAMGVSLVANTISVDAAEQEPVVTQTETPAQETAETPAQETAETPAQETAETPAQETAETPAQETAETPAQETAETPAQETAETPAQETAETPAQETAETPAQETAETPAQETAETPAQETAETPAQETAETPAQETAETPAQETAETPAQETAETQTREQKELAYMKELGVDLDEWRADGMSEEFIAESIKNSTTLQDKDFNASDYPALDAVETETVTPEGADFFYTPNIDNIRTYMADMINKVRELNGVNDKVTFTDQANAVAQVAADANGSFEMSHHGLQAGAWTEALGTIQQASPTTGGESIVYSVNSDQEAAYDMVMGWLDETNNISTTSHYGHRAIVLYANGSTMGLAINKYGLMSLVSTQNATGENGTNFDAMFAATGELPATKVVGMSFKAPVEEVAPTTVSGNVNYVDESGKTVKREAYNGTPESALTIAAPDGYDLVDQSASIPAAGGDVTIAVKAIVVAPVDDTLTVTVSFVNPEDGNKEVGTQVVTGKLGDRVTLAAPAGFEIVDGNTAITINKAETTKTVLVLATGVSGNINYVTSDGSVIKSTPFSTTPGADLTIEVPEGYAASDEKVYAPLADGDVTINLKKILTGSVNYVDGSKTVKSDKYTNVAGTKLALSLPEGYELVDASDVVIPENGGDVAVAIKAIVVAPTVVTGSINYVDAAGKTVKSEAYTSAVGGKLSVSAPDGYELVDATDVVAPAENKDVTIAVKAIVVAPTTVSGKINYVDATGKTVKSEEFTKEPGEKLSISAPEGFELVDSSSVVAPAADGDVTIAVKAIVVAPTTVSGKINYVDATGKTVKSEEFTKEPGEKLSISAPEGFELVDSSSVVAPAADGDVTIAVKAIVVAPTTVSGKINYVDATGKTVKSEEFTKEPGEKLSISAPEGFELVDSNSVVAPAADGDVTIAVKAIVVAPTTVSGKINYVDATGKTVKSEEFTKEPGEKLSISAPEGFELVDSSSVVAPAADGDVTIAVNASTPVDPDAGKDPVVDPDDGKDTPVVTPEDGKDTPVVTPEAVVTTKAPVAASKVALANATTPATNSNHKLLPQTGEADSLATIILGESLFTLGLAMVVRRRRLTK